MVRLTSINPIAIDGYDQILGSDVLFLQLPLQPTIILCSAKAAFDLMDRRSNIYSDKPQVLMDEL